VTLAQATYSLPTDATPNNGGKVGPFCCQGKTVTVRSTSGEVVGYAYWFQWAGQAYDAPHDGSYDSMYPDIKVLINDPQAGTASIDLVATELGPGVSRTASIGRLTFTVTFEAVSFTTYQGKTFFWERGLQATLTVRVR
jgi:hypothetical protein